MNLREIERRRAELLGEPREADAPIAADSDAATLAESLPDPRPGPDAAAEAAERRRLVAAGLAALPERERSVVALRMLGWTAEEVGSAVGLSRTGAQLATYRAVSAMRVALAASSARLSGAEADGPSRSSDATQRRLAGSAALDSRRRKGE